MESDVELPGLVMLCTWSIVSSALAWLSKYENARTEGDTRKIPVKRITLKKIMVNFIGFTINLNQKNQNIPSFLKRGNGFQKSNC
jgi:hypothetical protein